MQREVLRKMTVKKDDTMSKNKTPVSFSKEYSNNNINILTIPKTESRCSVISRKTLLPITNTMQRFYFLNRLDEWANSYTNI